jgi:carbon monoxide dehydrogenase subunit G
MEMTGEYRIAASRAQVWAALNDPEVLKASIPGCEALDMTSETEMTAKVVSKIGPVKATFTGKVRLENINAPESYTIAGEGQGGVAGFAKGGADVKLVEDGSETVLTYIARAQIGGKLAQLGSRLVDSTAKMMADQFFAKFAAIVAEHSLVAAGGAPVVEPETLAAASAATASGSAAPVRPAAVPATAAQTPSSTATGPSAGLPTWLVPAGALIVGLLIGKFLL